MEKNQVSNALSNVGDPIKAAVTLGDMFKESGLFGIKERAQGHVLALACLTEGMSPFQLMRRFHIVEGRLTQRADAMLAEFKAAGGRVRWIQWDDEAAKAEFEYQGDKIENVFSWEMAKAAKYPFKSDGGIKANWAASRPDMLRARLITKTLRMLAPDIVAGIYTPEELDDDRLPDTDRIPTGNAPLIDPAKEIKPPKDESPASAAPTAPASHAPESAPESAPEAPSESAPTADFIGKGGELFSSQVLADLSEFPEAANMYLSEFLKWIKPGWTFRDLGESHQKRIGVGNSNFRKKAEDFFANSQKEAVQ
jgi:hypothetical protein